jgi:hypothetical protein
VILADDQIGTLAGCFVVAVVIVAPFGYRQVRKVRRTRALLAAPLRAEPVVEPLDQTDLASAVARIAAQAADQDLGTAFTVSLPVGATIGGRPADRAIIESIVADGLRRDGVEIVERTGDAWQCRRPEVTH